MCVALRLQNHYRDDRSEGIGPAEGTMKVETKFNCDPSTGCKISKFASCGGSRQLICVGGASASLSWLLSAHLFFISPRQPHPVSTVILQPKSFCSSPHSPHRSVPTPSLHLHLIPSSAWSVFQSRFEGSFALFGCFSDAEFIQR